MLGVGDMAAYPTIQLNMTHNKNASWIISTHIYNLLQPVTLLEQLSLFTQTYRSHSGVSPEQPVALYVHGNLVCVLQILTPENGRLGSIQIHGGNLVGHVLTTSVNPVQLSVTIATETLQI